MRGKRGRRLTRVVSACVPRIGADTSDEARFYLGVEKAVLFNTPEEGLTEAEATSRLEKFGKNQLPEKEDNKLLKLATEFVQPMPLMIWAAIFIEARPSGAYTTPCGTLRAPAACCAPARTCLPMRCPEPFERCARRYDRASRLACST